jgi:hypothetical protein
MSTASTRDIALLIVRLDRAHRIETRVMSSSRSIVSTVFRKSSVSISQGKSLLPRRTRGGRKNMTTTENNGNQISTTDNLHFACYLETSGKLAFVGCTPSGVGNKILFRFRDPSLKLEQLFDEYVNGAVVPAIDLFTSLRTIRRAMGEVSISSPSPNTTTRNGKSHVSHQT